MSQERRENRLISAVADWRRRSRELAARLRSTAREDDAWLWRIHLRILRYLLRRYEHSPPEQIEPVNTPLIDIDPLVIGPIRPSEGRPRTRLCARRFRYDRDQRAG